MSHSRNDKILLEGPIELLLNSWTREQLESLSFKINVILMERDNECEETNRGWDL